MKIRPLTRTALCSIAFLRTRWYAVPQCAVWRSWGRTQASTSESSAVCLLSDESGFGAFDWTGGSAHRFTFRSFISRAGEARNTACSLACCLADVRTGRRPMVDRRRVEHYERSRLWKRKKRRPKMEEGVGKISGCRGRTPRVHFATMAGCPCWVTYRDRWPARRNLNISGKVEDRGSGVKG